MKHHYQDVQEHELAQIDHSEFEKLAEHSDFNKNAVSYSFCIKWTDFV